MFSIATLWIPFTITAALGQVARNAMQRQLTGPLGTWGATNIRFLFGFPFSVVFFVVVLAATGDVVPWPTAAFWPWLLLGALSQIVATALMLLAMNDRSFVVTTAYLKTEAIQTAIFGFVFLGDHLTVLKVVAILIATIGVVITALRPGGAKGFADLKPTVLGLVAAAAFALSAVGFLLPGSTAFFAVSFFVQIGLFATTSPVNAAFMRAVPTERRASAMALSIFSTHLFGDLWSAALLGVSGSLADLGLSGHPAEVSVPGRGMQLAWLLPYRGDG